MASLIKTDQNDTTRKVVWLLLAVSINALELAIPRLPFLPWLKPGFANVITILWISRYGFTDALLYSVLRVWISGFYFGFSLLTLALGLSGGILSTVVMALLWKTLGKRNMIGSVGLGIAGALFHNIGQLSIVYLVMAQNTRIFYQLPFMFAAALVFGGMVGGLAPHVGKLLDKAAKGENSDFRVTSRGRISTLHRIICGTTFVLSISLMFVDSLAALLAAAVIMSFVGFAVTNRNIKSLVYPARFYLIFLFIGCMHLFFSYGTRLDFFPAVTREGLLSTAAQWLRLWTWLQATHLFRKYHFDKLIMETLERVFPNKSATLEAGLLALEYFPKTVQSVRESKKVPLKSLLFKPRKTIETFVERMYAKINLLSKRKDVSVLNDTQSSAETLKSN